MQKLGYLGSLIIQKYTLTQIHESTTNNEVFYYHNQSQSTKSLFLLVKFIINSENQVKCLK